MKIVDNLGITGYLDNLIVDISREFGDTAHLASNCKQARNIFAALDITEEIFVEQYVYPARQRTKRQTKVRTKMAYFFERVMNYALQCSMGHFRRQRASFPRIFALFRRIQRPLVPRIRSFGWSGHKIW